MKNKTYFYIFLIINAFLWSFLSLFRNIIGNDALEAISWGELISFGTNKHPPFSGWLMGGAYNFLGQNDFAAYFLGQICILTGFIFIYKLAKFFMSKEKAMCSSLIMSSCYYFTYVAFYENFNCNFLSMALWPIIAYYYYKSIKTEKIKNWILFGIFSGIGVLTKYQVIFLFVALFIHLIICERKQFKRFGMYAAILSGFLVILPHILWLVKNEFFSFIYMTGRTEVGIHNTPPELAKFGRIVFPVKFYLDQLLSCISCILLFGIIAFQAKNISFLKDKENLSEKVFLLSIGFVPIILQGGMAIITNSRIQGMWGSMMVSFSGILLFYFFPILFKENTFKFCLKCSYVIMTIWLIIMTIFLQLQTKFHMSFPYQKIMPDIDKIWSEQTENAKLKYVGGHIDYVFKFNVYNSNHPQVILETFGHRNPWINHDDVLKSGVLIISKKPEELIEWAKQLVILLPDEYTITPYIYEFDIKNRMNKVKHFKFYYTIIPPME